MRPAKRAPSPAANAAAPTPHDSNAFLARRGSSAAASAAIAPSFFRRTSTSVWDVSSWGSLWPSRSWSGGSWAGSGLLRCSSPRSSWIGLSPRGSARLRSATDATPSTAKSRQTRATAGTTPTWPNATRTRRRSAGCAEDPGHLAAHRREDACLAGRRSLPVALDGEAHRRIPLRVHLLHDERSRGHPRGRPLACDAGRRADRAAGPWSVPGPRAGRGSAGPRRDWAGRLAALLLRDPAGSAPDGWESLSVTLGRPAAGGEGSPARRDRRDVRGSRGRSGPAGPQNAAFPRRRDPRKPRPVRGFSGSLYSGRATLLL